MSDVPEKPVRPLGPPGLHPVTGDEVAPEPVTPPEE
jgi:hypothetical protein